MFKLLKNTKGQGITIQYVLTFFLVVALASAMTVYVRRTLQGRIRDARTFMGLEVNGILGNPSYNIVGNFLISYEPYYANQTATRAIDSTETHQHMQNVPSSPGTFQMDIDRQVTSESTSSQLPPVNAM